jgi:phosphopantothenoylcysteine synthetase/decarboxylase
MLDVLRNPMRVLLTCGPSYEPIDDVRRITNFSTGQLGVRLANALTHAGHAVTCFKGVGATTHERVESARVVPFSTNDDLLARLAAVERREEIDAFLHAAALSDFKVQRDGSGERKLSSRAGSFTLTLVPAAKVIAKLRGLFPRARIVGWKYELDGTREEALAKGARQIAENATDACVVNGAAYGHGFGVLRPGEPLVALEEKAALVAWLVQWLEAVG